jgi:molybdopterin synthase catalytic subunit
VAKGIDPVSVRVQTEDFDTGAEISRMRLARRDTGAVVAFVGQVRDINDGSEVSTLTLEHYQGMTEKALEAIIDRARSRWDIFDALIIHRVGTLQPTDQIVLVLVSGAHRGEAFSACEFIMDYLKTEAPFWKKEETPAGTRWIDARVSDDLARDRWEK